MLERVFHLNEKMREILETPPGERIWIAAHRGKFGGCIPENTLDAFDAAILAGADIVETDITKLADGSFILFHDPGAGRMLGLPGEIADYTFPEVRELQLPNAIGEPSGRCVNTLDELLSHLKGRSLINLDKCRDYLDEVYEKVLEYDMEDQILLKNPVPCTKDIEWLKRTGYRPLYVPVVQNDGQLEALYRVLDEIEVHVVEVFIHQETDKLISAAFIEEMHRRGIKVWLNALTLGKDNNLCAGRDDDRSLLQSPDEGWGWIAAHGIDIIQTDWVTELGSYLKQIGKR